MDSFPPIDQAMCSPQRQGIHDSEFLRTVRMDLKTVDRVSRGYRRPNTWGFTIYRTEALHRIRAYVEVFANGDLTRRPLPREQPLDRAPNAELIRRFQNDVIEDVGLLDGASVADVAAHFEQWEVLDQIAQLPDPPDSSKEKWYRWVKIVTRWHPEPGAVPGTTAYDRGPYWFRCGVPKLADFWLAAIDIEIDQFGELDEKDGIISYVGRR
ncbi:hypothetical protein B0O99DRAFT_684875 [Bisporella sp. PMI_857]|nr:hypothetical protein B0O99DRAFT_684875 [Bisporella sp. PMI_857]